MWRNGLRMGAMLAVLAACDDARLLAPDLDGAAARLRGAEMARFPCAWSVRAEGGPHRYRYGRAAVAVPRPALAPDGATAEYRYVVQAPGADPVYVARCIVPATRAAFEHLDRRFGVVRAATPSATTGDAVARGCVSDRECILEPITVQPCADPSTDPAESTPDCGGGGGGDPGWWTGGGGPYEPPPDDGGGGGGGGGDPGGEDPGGDDPYPPEPCDTGDPVVDSPEVQQGFADLWSRSNPDAEMQDRLERGGWIIQGPAGYSVQPFPESWTLNACEIRFPVDALAPTGAVAWVHTHPYRSGERLTACGSHTIYIGGVPMKAYFRYGNQPSEDDGKFSTLWNKPGYVIDKNKITRFIGNASSPDHFDVQSQVNRCGY